MAQRGVILRESHKKKAPKSWLAEPAHYYAFSFSSGDGKKKKKEIFTRYEKGVPVVPRFLFPAGIFHNKVCNYGDGS